MTFGIDTPADFIPQDRDPVAAAKRVSASENGHFAVADALAQRAADMRTAAVLNALAVAKAHGCSPEWTEGDVARIREILVMTNEIAGGANDAETIPQGFGPLVRARQTEALLRAVAKAAAPGDGVATGTTEEGT